MGNIAAEVNVTKKDIENGCREDPTMCMVALAMRRIVLPSCAVNVAGDNNGHYDLDYNEAVVRKGKDEQVIKLPIKVGDKIIYWDDGKETEPFKFKVKLPEWCLRSSVVKATLSKSTPKTTKKKATQPPASKSGKTKAKKASAR